MQKKSKVVKTKVIETDSKNEETKTREKDKNSRYNDSLLGNENIGDFYSFDEILELIELAKQGKL